MLLQGANKSTDGAANGLLNLDLNLNTDPDFSQLVPSYRGSILTSSMAGMVLSSVGGIIAGPYTPLNDTAGALKLASCIFVVAS